MGLRIPEGEPAAAPPAVSPTSRWPTWVARVAKTLIALGVLVLLFTAYQLWGTGIAHDRAQDDLEREFAARREAELSRAGASTTAATSTRSSTTAAGSAATTAAPATGSSGATGDAADPISQGDGIARIVIDRIDVDEIVVAGVGRADLQKGPGHYPDTPLPGQRGNAAIAGHRTTYGAPFGHLDELEPGDAIDITTYTGQFRYRVTEQVVVTPGDVWVIDPTRTATLTLTTCHPRYSARQRLVIKAALDARVSSAPTAATPGSYEQTGPLPDERDAVEGDREPSSPTAGSNRSDGSTSPTQDRAIDALSEGWFADSSAWLPTVLWGLLGGAVATGAWLLARRTRRLVAYPLATPLLLVVLYFFFENLSRLLPVAL